MDRLQRIFTRKHKLPLLLMKQAKNTASRLLVPDPSEHHGGFYVRQDEKLNQETYHHIAAALDLAYEHMEVTLLHNVLLYNKLQEMGVDVKAFLDIQEDIFFPED